MVDIRVYRYRAGCPFASRVSKVCQKSDYFLHFSMCREIWLSKPNKKIDDLQCVALSSGCFRYYRIAVKFLCISIVRGKCRVRLNVLKSSTCILFENKMPQSRAQRYLPRKFRMQKSRTCTNVIVCGTVYDKACIRNFVFAFELIRMHDGHVKERSIFHTCNKNVWKIHGDARMTAMCHKTQTRSILSCTFWLRPTHFTTYRATQKVKRTLFCLFFPDACLPFDDSISIHSGTTY